MRNGVCITVVRNAGERYECFRWPHPLSAEEIGVAMDCLGLELDVSMDRLDKVAEIDAASVR